MLTRLLRLLPGLCLALVASAGELHQATPVEQLAASCHSKGHAAAALVVSTTPPPTPDDFDASAVKTFNISAHQFAYTVSPTPFVVNQGDSVTLNITSTDTTHGFQMEQYSKAFTITRGQTTVVSFVANVAGTFTYFCTVVCGDGHPNMSGIFTVTAAPQDAPLTVTSVTPDVVPITGGTVVKITGTGFKQGARVTCQGIDATNVTVESSTSITATTPRVPNGGSQGIEVINPDGASAVGNFTYLIPLFKIDSVTPPSGSTAGGNDVEVRVSGGRGAAITGVTIGGLSPLKTRIVAADDVIVTVPPGPFNLVDTAFVDLAVVAADGSVAGGAYQYVLPPPAITRLSTGTASPAGGTPVTITGAGFTTALPITVKFGGTSATSVSVVNAFTLVAIAPAHAAGSADVVVTVGTASATSPTAITYVAAPPRRHGTRH